MPSLSSSSSSILVSVDREATGHNGIIINNNNSNNVTGTSTPGPTRIIPGGSSIPDHTDHHYPASDSNSYSSPCSSPDVSQTESSMPILSMSHPSISLSSSAAAAATSTNRTNHNQQSQLQQQHIMFGGSPDMMLPHAGGTNAADHVNGHHHHNEGSSSIHSDVHDEDEDEEDENNNNSSHNLMIPGQHRAHSDQGPGSSSSSSLTLGSGRRKKGSTAGGAPIRPACPECGKDFSNQSALSKHKLTHSDVRRFSCQLCGKAFKRQDHLNGHMLTHRDKKPYECDVDGCEKTYCDARSLRRHKENHHQQQQQLQQQQQQQACNSTSTASPAGAAVVVPSPASLVNGHNHSNHGTGVSSLTNGIAHGSNNSSSGASLDASLLAGLLSHRTPQNNQHHQQQHHSHHQIQPQHQPQMQSQQPSIQLAPPPHLMRNHIHGTQHHVSHVNSHQHQQPQGAVLVANNGASLQPQHHHDPEPESPYSQVSPYDLHQPPAHLSQQQQQQPELHSPCYNQVVTPGYEMDQDHPQSSHMSQDQDMGQDSSPCYLQNSPFDLHQPNPVITAGAGTGGSGGGAGPAMSQSQLSPYSTQQSYELHPHPVAAASAGASSASMGQQPQHGMHYPANQSSSSWLSQQQQHQQIPCSPITPVDHQPPQQQQQSQQQAHSGMRHNNTISNNSSTIRGNLVANRLMSSQLSSLQHRQQVTRFTYPPIPYQPILSQHQQQQQLNDADGLVSPSCSIYSQPQSSPYDLHMTPQHTPHTPRTPNHESGNNSSSNNNTTTGAMSQMEMNRRAHSLPATPVESGSSVSFTFNSPASHTSLHHHNNHLQQQQQHYQHLHHHQQHLQSSTSNSHGMKSNNNSNNPLQHATQSLAVNQHNGTTTSSLSSSSGISRGTTNSATASSGGGGGGTSSSLSTTCSTSSQLQQLPSPSPYDLRHSSSTTNTSAAAATTAAAILPAAATASAYLQHHQLQQQQQHSLSSLLLSKSQMQTQQQQQPHGMYQQQQSQFLTSVAAANPTAVQQHLHIKQHQPQHGVQSSATASSASGDRTSAPIALTDGLVASGRSPALLSTAITAPNAVIQQQQQLSVRHFRRSGGVIPQSIPARVIHYCNSIPVDREQLTPQDVEDILRDIENEGNNNHNNSNNQSNQRVNLLHPDSVSGGGGGGGSGIRMREGKLMSHSYLQMETSEHAPAAGDMMHEVHQTNAHPEHQQSPISDSPVTDAAIVPLTSSAAGPPLLSLPPPPLVAQQSHAPPQQHQHQTIVSGPASGASSGGSSNTLLSSPKRHKHKPEPIYIPPHVNACGFVDRTASSALNPLQQQQQQHQSLPLLLQQHPNLHQQQTNQQPPFLQQQHPLQSRILGNGCSSSQQQTPVTPVNFTGSNQHNSCTPYRFPPLTARSPRLWDGTGGKSPFSPLIWSACDAKVNIGSQYQARIPELLAMSGIRKSGAKLAACSNTGVSKLYRPDEMADLVFDPKILQDGALSDEEMDQFLAVACSSCVPGAGRNMEYAYHVMHESRGDLTTALIKLLDPDPRISASDPLVNYHYPESHSWSAAQISAYYNSLVKCDKDFEAISRDMGPVMNKSVKQCIEFYYLWKKVCPAEYRKLRMIRRKREQEGIYYNNNNNSNAVTDKNAVTEENKNSDKVSSNGRNSTDPSHNSSHRAGNRNVNGKTATDVDKSCIKETNDVESDPHNGHRNDEPGDAFMDEDSGDEEDELEEEMPDEELMDEENRCSSRFSPSPSSSIASTDQQHQGTNSGGSRVICSTTTSSTPVSHRNNSNQQSNGCLRQHQDQEKEFPCKVCGKVFPKVKSRAAHMKIHRNIHR